MKEIKNINSKATVHKLEVDLHFGGFYESIHDDIVQRSVASSLGYEEMDDGLLPEEFYELDINWEKARIEYCKDLVDVYNDGLDLNLKYVFLRSPREYNYHTDEIYVEVIDKDIPKIKAMVNQKDLKEMITGITTSSSGYVALFDYDDFYKEEHLDLLLGACFRVIKDDNYLYVEDFMPTEDCINKKEI